ncbi:MAG: hypothetical protein FVQ79_11030 [Planctomycetes bacterium]|nr:hypothetical protein [Planctomycetota bacterium]
METLWQTNNNNREGIVMVLALMFMVIFASLSVAMLSMSSANAQIANNHQQGNGALVNTHSGVEVVKYFLNDMTVPASIETGIQNQLAVKNLTNMTATVTGSVITLASVPLDSTASENFSAQITMFSDYWQADVTGRNGVIKRKVRSNFNIAVRADSVFDYGVATKGPLLMTGQGELGAVNLAVESDVFIDTSIIGNAFEIGNHGTVAGNVHIVNPLATYEVGNNSEIGGETGEDAEGNIILDVDPVEFPVPDTDYFRQFATGDVIDANNLNDYLNDNETLDNVTIAANTNPTFSGDVTIRGVLYIEQPNKVKFAGKAVVQGIIVGDSIVGDESIDNNINFSGQVDCLDSGDLIGAEFDGIREETGTFLIAPGFSADFSGQSNIINGVIAIAGIRFTGQAGGTINGSIVNYSSDPMVLQGQGSLMFNRSGTDENPAGFEPVLMLDYDPSSYSEI